MAAFEANLEGSPALDGHKFIYNIFGQGGTGKTWLLRAFAESAARVDAPAGWSDDTEGDALSVLRRLVETLGNDAGFSELRESDQAYRSLVRELVAADDAPVGLASHLGYAAGRGALALGRQAPGLGLALEFADPEAAGSAGASIAAYLASKLRRAEDLELLSHPVDVLSRRFVEGLGSVAGDGRPVLLCFDTYEQTRAFVDDWLLALLEGRYGETPASLVIAVAGQVPLSYTRWSDNELWTERVPLDVFSEDEARAFLGEHGIHDQAVVAEVLRLSDRLPVLLATLASQSPRSAASIGDVTGTAADVFLKWIDDPSLRDTAIAGALPRVLNADTLGAVVGPEDAGRYLEPLLEMPFVEERHGGWGYHPVVRAQLIRHLGSKSPSRWAAAQRSLHKYFARLERDIEDQSDETPPLHDESWQRYEIEHVYHALCDGSSHLERTITNIIYQSQKFPGLVEKMCNAVAEAGEDKNEASLVRWGRVLRDYVSADGFTPLYAALTTILEVREPELPSAVKASVLRQRGVLLGTHGQPDEALVDFTTALAFTPNNPSLMIDQAVTLLRQEKPRSARDHASRALEVLDEGSDYMRAAALGVRATASAELGEDDAAVDDFTMALNLAPLDSMIRRGRAMLYAGRGDVDRAVADLREAIARDPDFAHTGLQNIGTVYSRAGRRAEAEAAILESLELNPDCGHCWEVICDLLADTDPLEAVEKLRVIGGEQLHAPGYAWRARAFAVVGAFPEALADVTRAIEDGHDAARVRNEQGLYFANLSQYEKAIVAFDAALDEDPEMLAALYNKAVVQLAARVSRVGETLEDLDAVLASAEPSLPEIVAYARAGLDAARGKPDEGLAQLRAVTRAIPDVVRSFLRTDIAWRPLGDPAEMQSLAGLQGAAE